MFSVISAIALAALMLGSANNPLTGPAGTPGPVRDPSMVRAPTLPANTSNFPTPIRHVFVIVMENSPAKRVLQYLPFQRYAAANFSYDANDYSMCHPSSANYIAMVSGNYTAVQKQCGLRTLSTAVDGGPTIGNLAQSQNLSWDAFYQGMSKPCDSQSNGTDHYASDVNALLFFSSVWNNQTLCKAHDLSFNSWYSMLGSSNIPNFAFFVPNLLNDGHNENHNYSDTWLANFVYDDFINQPFMKDSALFITYDEAINGAGFTSGNVTTTGGKTYLVAISPYSVNVANSSHPLYTRASPLSIFTTSAWLLGLPVANKSLLQVAPPLTGLFYFGNSGTYPLPPPPYSWTEVNATGPSPRAEPAMTYDPAMGYVLLFGGHNSKGQYADTWTFQNGTWTKLYFAPHDHPSARRGAMMTYDAACQCAVLFGGSSLVYYNDTWIFKNGAWTNITPTVGAAPPPRRVGQLVYDPASQQLVLFGGHGGYGLVVSTYSFLNDTWVLPANLSGTWTRLHTNITPPSRAEPMAAYSPATQSVILFGGYNNSTTHRDTWSFHNNTWTELWSSSAVPPRDGGDMVYDAALGGIVLFGGHHNKIFLTDAWLFNGTAWLPVYGWPSPVHRATERVAYDPVLGALVVFGGERSPRGPYLDDTWLLT